MAKNQSTYTLKIDAELGNLQKTLNEAKNSLASFMASGNAPKGLEKAFEKISSLLGQITDKAGKPLDLKGLSATGKDLTSIQENFRALIRLMGEFDDLSDDLKISFLSAEEQKKITSVVDALKAYGAAAEESAKKVKLLEAAQKNLAKDQSTLDKAKKKVSGVDNKKALKEAELSGAKTKLEAAQSIEGADPEKVAKYQARVVKLQADLDKLTKEQKEANNELKAAQSVYDASAQSVAKLEKEADRASKESLRKLKEEAKNLGISLDGLNGHNAAKQIEILTNRLEEFKNEALNSGRPAFDAMKKGFAQAEDAADKMGKEVSEATEVVKDMDEAVAARDAFEAKIKSFLGLSGAAQVLRSALRDAMATITELDATMTEMAVVTDLAVGDYWDQLPEYSQRASELGVSINSAYKAATLYYQQGLKTNEVTALSAETLKLAKIAGIDAAEATDKMTAALRGFNMELNEASAQKIADVYSELAAITAADVDEISTAMTKTASIASSAGMEFETTAAFLSQIIETTRESAETAGTAMKTVIARFQELKKDPSEIGEVDGEIVDANAIEGALRSVGVSLRDSAGQFRELDDVFLELSSKWNTLDKNTQRYIATIAAGSRQQSRFIAMMQDYGRTQELVTAANNSAGASQKQFEKTMESLSSKVEKLKNAWHEFTMGIMDSDLVKFGVDVLTKFLEVINKATSALDGVGGSLMKIVTVLGVFKLGSQIFSKFKEPVINLFADIVRRAGIAGTDSAKAYTNGLKQEGNKSEKKLKIGYSQDKKGRIHRTNGQFAKAGEGELGPRTAIQKFGDSTVGLSDWEIGIGGLKTTSQAKKELNKTGSRKQLISNVNKAKSKMNSGEQGAEEDYKKATEALEEYDKKSKAITEDQAKAWSSIGDGIAKVGSSMIMVGTGISAIGGVLSSLGLEEMGETISTIGTYITLAGTALMAIPPILSIITAILNTPPLGIITIILLAIIAALTIIMTIINNNSPEKKLQDTAEAAERAGEAAEEAAASYEKLNSALDNLSDKYKGLDELTRGTKEWNEAVQDINGSVLDLISEYPELAQFVESVDGVLTLDTNSAEVQNVLQQAQVKKINAQNTAILAKSAVSDAKNAETYSNLKQEIKDGYYGASEGTTDKVAKAIASGAIKPTEEGIAKFLQSEGIQDNVNSMAEAMLNNIEDLRSYGISLNAAETQQKMSFEAMATSAQSLADTLDWSTDEIAHNSNIVDGEMSQKFYETKIKELEGYTDTKHINDSEEVRNAIKAQYGETATIDDSGKVTYMKDGKSDSVTLTVEEIKSIVATQYATEQTKLAYENSKGIIDNFSTVLGEDLAKVLYEGDAGSELSQEQIKQLENTNIKTLWNTLSPDQKAAYNNDEAELAKDIQEIVEGARTSFASAEAILGERTISDANAKQSHEIAKVAKEMNDTEKDAFIDGLNTLTTGLTEEQKSKVLSSVAGMSTNPTDIVKWQSVVDTLAEFGVDAKEFISTTADALGARYSESDLSAMGVSQELISHYNNATGEELESFHDTFEQWRKRYNTANDKKAKTEHELINKVIDAMIEGYEEQIDAYEETSSAITEANDKLISRLSEKIQEDRQQRDNERAESDIANNRNRLAYLAADTSGGNALERLQLQKDIDQAEQDYQDSLVDQAIAKLEDANAKAAEQRERQIELARQQLEAYQNSNQIIEDAKYLINESVEKMKSGVNLSATAIGELLAPDRFVSEYEEGTFWKELSSQMSGLVNNDTNDNEGSSSGSGGEGSGGSDSSSGSGGSGQSPRGIGQSVSTSSSWQYADGTWELDLREGVYGSQEWLHNVRLVPAQNATELTGIYGKPTEDNFVLHNDTWYAAWRGGWYTIPTTGNPGEDQNKDNSIIIDLLNKKKGGTSFSPQFKTGGLADFTGPAWLDGTPSKPEYILNAAQTERFFSLVDVLEDIDTGDGSKKSSGDNYFDININVEKLEDDYDVEQMANKIRRMIYDDATYRNVNSINYIR